MEHFFRWPIGRVERYARRMFCAVARRLGHVPVAVPVQGAWFLVNPAEYIDRGIALDAIWEGPQLEFLARVCARRRMDYFIDVGANCGFYSVMFAARRLADAVIAFEPDPGNFLRLLANVRLNGLGGRIEPLEIALGDAAGEVLLYEGTSWNRGLSTIAVPEQTPRSITHVVKQVAFDDRYCIRGKSLMLKMDIEGYELRALAGMERTLLENQCYAQVEVYAVPLEELQTWFATRGYRHLRSWNDDHYFTNIAGLA